MKKPYVWFYLSRLVKLGLVVIEHTEKENQFLVVRPASLKGSDFRGWGEPSSVGMSATELQTNAPPALLRLGKNGWLVDISIPAAPGPGPIWFREEFTSAEDAVNAIQGCFFGDRVDNCNESLEAWYGQIEKKGPEQGPH